MNYLKLADVYEQLEGTTKKLEKTDILARLFKTTPKDMLYKVVLLSQGTVFPASSEEEIGIARNMMVRIISKATGESEKTVIASFKKTGDLGLTAEELVSKKKQRTLLQKQLTVEKVYNNLRKLPSITGAGSQDRKVALVAELISSAKPKEARYVVRTVLGELRVGVAAGLIRDAIAKAFNVEPGEVEKAFDLLTDYGKIAELARKGRKALKNVSLEVGSPIRVQLAESSGGLKEAMKAFKNSALEYKYDGFRVVVHKTKGKVKLFSRRLDDVTKQFPELVEWVKKQVRGDNFIVEGEVLAIGKDGKPRAFQNLSQRIKRKYGIEKMVKENPIQMNLFDLLAYEGKNYMGEPLHKRWKLLKKVVKQTKQFKLAEHIETKDLKKAEKFYRESLANGQEGLIVKNLDAIYKPGKRVGYWLKVKPIMEPLDLVIVQATWGEGKRAKWLSSLTLACRNEKGEFLPTGMMGTGLTEEQLEILTKKLKKLVIEERGRTMKVKPEIVVEVGYEEIQKSPKYPTGFALRFPRLLRFREQEKRPEDVNTVQYIEKLFKQQRGKK